MKKFLLLFFITALIISCGVNNENEGIDDDKLGFIEADVLSEDTEFKVRASYNSLKPGDGIKMDRSFENAPPMIPHTTAGFFPIKIDRNICLSCHMPEKAKEVNATEISKTHLMNIREQLILVDGIYTTPDEGVVVEKLEKLNNAYYNCSQCHAPQTEVTVNITNLFTPEFRKEFGISSSNLHENVAEGTSK